MGMVTDTFVRQPITRRAFMAVTLGAGIAALSGCRSAPVARAAPRTQAPGRSVELLTVGDVERRYVRYEPSTLDPTAPAPLVVALHGRGGSGRISELMFGLNVLADRHGFVVAYPDALGDPPTWNEGFVGMAGGPNRPDDLGFVRALVEREASARPLDPGRLFVCGHSSGGMMSYRLASEAGDLFAAAGIVAGSVGYRGPGGGVQTIPRPGRPVSIIHFHGTADTLVPYDGGWRGPGPTGFLPVADTVAFWVGANGCQSPPATETVGMARRETYSGGTAGTEVTLWTIEGGGHSWPQVARGGRRGDPPTGISASALIWEFFEAHGRIA
jgi:polyhydroxybutyrate depolymerase